MGGGGAGANSSFMDDMIMMTMSKIWMDNQGVACRLAYTDLCIASDSVKVVKGFTPSLKGFILYIQAEGD